MTTCCPSIASTLELCYIDTDSLVYDTKTDNSYENIANDVEARFDTSGYCNVDGRFDTAMLRLGLRQAATESSSFHRSKQEGHQLDERRTWQVNCDQVCGTQTAVVRL